MSNIDDLLDEALAAYEEPAEPTLEEPEGAAPEAADVKPEQTPETKVEEKIEDKLDSIINSKYGGDRDKFVEGLYEQWNSTSKLAKEMKELREQLVAANSPTERDEDLTSPQLDWLGKQAAKLDSEEKAKSDQLQKVIASYSQVEREIAKAEGELLRSDDLDKDRIESRIQNLKDKLESKQERFNNLQERLAEIGLEKEGVQQNLNWTKSQLQELRRQQLQEKVDEKQDQQQTMIDFVDAIKEHGAAFRIPKANLGHMANSIRGEIAVHLRSLGENAPKIDIGEAVKVRVAAYAKAMGLGAAAPKITMPGGKPIPAAKIPPGQPANNSTPKNAKEAAKLVDDVFAKFGI